MALSPKLPILILIITLSSVTASASNDDLVAELLSLRSTSNSGVIHLDDHSISRFLASATTPRPYSIFLFFDAVQFHDRPELRLAEYKKQFNLVSSSFIKNNPNNAKIFFCDIEFQYSNLTYTRFGVRTLPHIRLVGPTQGFTDSEPMSKGDTTRFAESMAEFIEFKTNISVGPIHRPPLLSRIHIILITLAILAFIPYFIKKFIAGQTLFHSRKLWLAGSLFVYFFSVSGCMNNIIKKAPMYLVDNNNPSKLVFFYQGHGMQLGAEGFIVGFLYTVVGLLLAFLTQGLVKVSNVIVKTLVMLIALAVSVLIVKQVVVLTNWKTGYGIHGFWPSGWN
ncbi:hypothetical protein TanjilG_24768 [Lupinus angustifolius]|uniref:Dolichyl-diphosphooligosaccharide--protein glycosyltransferase subunit 3B n=1 Tax=Lupinus angustifolius TaxID=3871 RepID=A0A4P1RKT6_LUPAN|nr:PREDICTED: probable dolichyl-diphosphooligosaccharide--protein glycosyltransferase subunit 3B [Lupinus angustifolius]OIW12835.1 hypothetical protein TanjilG_24768 [Lupinus angustifolius]